MTSDDIFENRKEGSRPMQGGESIKPRRQNLKVVPIILLLDTSGSMVGTAISALNMGIKTLLTNLHGMTSGDNRTSDIKIIAVKFGSEADYVQGIDSLLSPQEYKDKWQDLEADGFTSLGAALDLLNEVLVNIKNKAYENVRYSSPVIMLFSDGASTDVYKERLDTLWQNEVFKGSVLRAVECGDNCDRDMLKQFTGSDDKIIKFAGMGKLANIIVYEIIKATELSRTL